PALLPSFPTRRSSDLIYERWNLTFGCPVDIFSNGGLVSTITPPVLERWGEDLVSVEGNTRIFYSSRTGRTSIPALVVEGVAQPLDRKSTRLNSSHVKI